MVKVADGSIVHEMISAVTNANAVPIDNDTKTLYKKYTQLDCEGKGDQNSNVSGYVLTCSYFLETTR
jgi:hypothetical protein